MTENYFGAEMMLRAPPIKKRRANPRQALEQQTLDLSMLCAAGNVFYSTDSMVYCFHVYFLLGVLIVETNFFYFDEISIMYTV